MPISIILIGICLIILAFGYAKKMVKDFFVNRWVLIIINLILFVVMFLKPVYLWGSVYVSIGGFIFLSIFSLYLLTKVGKKNYLNIAFSALVLLLVIMSFNLLFNFDQEQVFFTTIFAIGLSVGVTSYFVCNNLTNAFVSLVFSSNLFNIIYFIINKNEFPNLSLLLGVGVVFEASIIALFTSFMFFNFFEDLKVVKKQNKVQKVIENKEKKKRYKKEGIV